MGEWSTDYVVSAAGRIIVDRQPLGTPAVAGHGQQTKLPDARNHYIDVKHPFLLPQQPLFLLQHSGYNQEVNFSRCNSFTKKPN